MMLIMFILAPIFPPLAVRHEPIHTGRSLPLRPRSFVINIPFIHAHHPIHSFEKSMSNKKDNKSHLSMSGQLRPKCVRDLSVCPFIHKSKVAPILCRCLSTPIVLLFKLMKRIPNNANHLLFEERYVCMVCFPSKSSCSLKGIIKCSYYSRTPLISTRLQGSITGTRSAKRLTQHANTQNHDQQAYRNDDKQRKAKPSEHHGRSSDAALDAPVAEVLRYD